MRTLQSHWPGTKLTWVIGKTEASLVGDISGIEFIILDKSKGWSAYRDLRRRMRGRRFDVLLRMQPALRTSIASLFIKAPIRLGFDKVRARDYQWLFTSHRIPATREQHVVDGFFSFLEHLGLSQRELRWDIPIPDEAHVFAAQHLPGPQPTLIISPCSSHPLRNWRAEHYAQIADYAIEKHGFRVVLCGGPGPLEREYGDVIRQHMRNRPLDLIGKDTLKRMLALLARAHLLLSPDSGPAHMATCVGTPVIGLYAASNTRRTGPYLSRVWCVDKYDEAARRYLKKPAAAIRWGTKLEYPGVMELIQPQEVIDKLDLLMKTDGRLSRESV
ncbi:MAG: glycosyltransferase family 9 protein [Acidiferrobacterales bacterium]